MDLARVRRFFQVPWDIYFLTDNQASHNDSFYSLQQPSINSDEQMLFVTTKVDPELLGDLIVINRQRFIVHKEMVERSNKDLTVYKLVVAYDDVILSEYIRHKNAIGAYVDNVVIEHHCACAVAEYGKKERIKPSSQPVDSYEQEFLIAFKQLPDYRGAYKLNYHGITYKVTSFEVDGGLLKIRAVEDL
jgi:hypothetical protein